MSMFVYNLPLITSNSLSVVPSSINIVELFIPFIIGGGALVAYSFITKHQEKEAFKKINKELEESAIPENANICTIEDNYSKESVDIMKRIYSIKKELIKNKLILEEKSSTEQTVIKDSSNLETELEKDFSKKITDADLERYQDFLTETSENELTSEKSKGLVKF